MGRYLLLWFLGIPIPVLILIWAFGGLNCSQKQPPAGGRFFICREVAG